MDKSEKLNDNHEKEIANLRLMQKLRFFINFDRECIFELLLLIETKCH